MAPYYRWRVPRTTGEEELALFFDRQVEEPEVHILLFVRKHPWKLVTSAALAILVYLVLLLLFSMFQKVTSDTQSLSDTQMLVRFVLPLIPSGCYFLVQYWIYLSEYLLMTNQHITTTRRIPLFYENRLEIPLKRVLDVSSEVPHRLARKVGYGDLIITVRGVSDEIRISQFYQPEKRKIVINAFIVDRRQAQLMRIATAAIDSSDNAICAYGLHLFLRELSEAPLSDEQVLDWTLFFASKSSTLSQLRTRKPKPKASTSEFDVLLDVDVIRETDLQLQRLELTDLFVELAGLSQNTWSGLVAFALAWENACSNASQSGFEQAVTETARLLGAHLGIPCVTDKEWFGYKSLWYPFELDASRAFAGTRMKPMLPLLFMRQPELLESQTKRLTPNSWHTKYCSFGIAS